MEANTCQVINSRALSLNTYQEKLDLVDCTSNVISEGLNLAVSHINADLKELDNHVACHHRECKSNEIVINLCQAWVSELEWLIEAQAQVIAHLEERVKEVTCKC